LRQNFNALVTNLSQFERLPDLIFVTEIEIDNYFLPGYTFYAQTNDKYSAGGVGVFYKSNLNCRAINCNFSAADVIELNCVIGTDNFTFTCFYRLHSQPITQFFTELEHYLGRKNSHNLILIGDFNIDVLADNENSDLYLSILAKHGLLATQAIRALIISFVISKYYHLS